MIVDVKRIFAENTMLDDPYAERSLLAAILFDQRALADLAELEVADFFVLQHATIFTAIRNVEAIGADVNVDAVFDELARMDRERGGVRGDSHLLDHCAPAIVDLLWSRIVMDAAPDELRWLFDRVRTRRTNRERLAA